MSERPPQLLAPNGEPFNSEPEAEEPRELIIPGQEEAPMGSIDDLVIPGQAQGEEEPESKELVPHDYAEPGNPEDLLAPNGEPFNSKNKPKKQKLIIPGEEDPDFKAPDPSDLILPGSDEFTEEMGATATHSHKDYSETAGGQEQKRRELFIKRIDEADAMKRPTKRMKALQALAYEAQAEGEIELAIEAASRIRVSKTRKKRSLSQLWISNVLAHDQVMRDLADNADQAHLKVRIAENIRFGYKRNPVMGAVIDSAYDGASENLSQIDNEKQKAREAEEEIAKGWHLMGSAQTEDRARELRNQAKGLTEESSKKLEAPTEDHSPHVWNETDTRTIESKEARLARIKEAARLDEQARKLQREAKGLFGDSDAQYESEQESAGQGWHLMGAASFEDEVRDLEQRAVELASENLRGWGASKYFGEAVVRRALFKKDPAVLTALGGIRHLLRKRRAKKTFKEEAQA